MSKYGDALDALDQERGQQAVATASAAGRYNPDQYAQAISRGSELGVPAHVVANNQQAFDRKSKYGEALDAMDAPTTQEWMSNFDNAAVAQDDRENLSMLERGLRRLRPFADFQRASAAGFVKTPGATLSGIGRLIEAGGRHVERGVRAIPGGDWLADVETPWWITPSEILRRPGQVIKQAGESIDVPEERQNLATDISGGVGQLGAQVITQILTGGTGSALTLAGQGADTMGDRAEAAGATPEQTDAAVLAGASITALTERYGLDALLNRVPQQVKNQVLSRLTDIAVGGGIEAAQEAFEGVLHNLTAQAYIDPNTPLFEGIEREALAAGGAGAIARAVLGAIIPGRQMSFADQDRVAAEQITQIAQQSKLAVRSPEKLEELVAAIKQQTGSEFAYLDPAAFRTLYQSDQEAAQAAADLAGSPTTYFEAAVSNTKMAIPMEKYVARIAANKNAQVLIDHVTFSSDGITAAEAKIERELNIEGRAKEIAEREVTEARPDSSQAVFDNVLGQLLATGMERSTAEKNAALTQAVFRTLGRRTGIDAQQLYQRYRLKVQREIPGILGAVSRVEATIDPIIDQLRAGDIPTEEQATAALNAGDSRLMDRRATLIQLGDFLAKAGVDLKATDNATIKKLLVSQTGTQFDQGDKSKSSGSGEPADIGSANEQPVRSAGTETDQDRRTTVGGTRPAEGWQTATRIRGKSGQPLRLYRGASRPLAATDFEDGSLGAATGHPSSGLGVFFTTDQADASRYGEVSNAFLDLRNPKLVKIEDVPAFDSLEEAIAWRDKQKTAGHDGLVISASHLGGPNWVVAFNPDQVIVDPTTLYQSSSVQTETSQFKQWFGNSKAVDRDGKPLVLYHGTRKAWDAADGPVWLTDDTEIASEYAQSKGGEEIIELYAKAENPFRVSSNDDVREFLASHGWSEKDINRVAPEDERFTFEWFSSKKVISALQSEGYDSVYLENDTSNDGSTEHSSWLMFRPEQIKSAVANRGTFDSISPNIFEQRFDETRRGAIQFGTDRQFTISLLEKADLSTFLHESGHLYLEIMADLAEDANAPQQVKDDFAKILKWMGVKDRASIQTDHHEQWARGFEAYLMEGKAPSVEMQSVFARFRAWLVGVYRTIARLNVNLTDDVRRVMDRMVATDDEIAAAEESQNYAPIFTSAEQAGMSAEEWAAYKDIASRAHQEATQEMTDRFVQQLSREQKAWWKEERAKVRDEVLAEVNEQPVYRALAFLQKGTNADGSPLPDGVQAAKLNKAALVDRYGKDFLKRLPRGLTAKEGINADVAASLFGFDSGDALVEALANARPKNQLIEMEADARMREKYGDMLTDGSIAEQAMQSVHTEGRAKVMAAELKALNRKRREVKPFVKAAKDRAAREQQQAREANAATLPDADELKAIKAGVQRIIQGKKVRDIQPNLYRVAEAKAARKAFEFAGKGDFEKAYIEKRRQILNHELYRAAVKAREGVDSIVEYMRRFDKKATRERIAKAKGQFLEQIDALRERFDFSNVSNVADLKRTALVQWVAEQEAAGREVNVPEYLLNEARKTPYKELLLAELQGLHDAVKNIEHLAKTKDRLLKNRAEAEWQDAKQELSERLDGQKGKAPPVSKFERTRMEEYGALANEMVDSWLRPETIVEWLDGGESGPWHDYFMEPANNAEYKREQLREQVLKPLRDLAENVSKERRNQLHEDIRIDALGMSFNRRTLLSIVLNMGNESNLERLTTGGFRDGGEVRQFTPQALQEIVGKLNAADVQFLNTAWSTVEQLWPEVVEFQKRMGGLVPEKIEAMPIQTAHGPLIGGYWPVVYDSLATRAGQTQAESTDPIQTIMGANFARATTKKGHTKGRTAVAGPLLLDYAAVAGRHVEQVITDLTHREVAMQAMKILDDPDLRLRLQDAAGETAWKSLRGMVRHAVEQDGGFSEAASRGQERIQRRLLSNTAVAALGFRAVTAWGNMVLAPIQAGARVAPKYIAIGLGRFYRHPKDSTKFIQDSSEMMRQRAQNLDHTLNVVMETLQGQRGFRAKVAQASMAMHTTADYLMTHGIWLGRYQETLDAGESHDEAVRLADKSIRQTQTAGAPKDLSAFERDPRYRWHKLFLGPMLIQGNRIRESLGRKGVVKSWPQAFGTLMAAWFLPAVMWDLVAGRGPDDDDDDGIADDAALWSLRKIFFYPFLTMPFIRDAASIVERKIEGKYAEPRMTPLADAGYLVWQAGRSAWKETGDWMDGGDFEADKAIKSGLRASGPLFGIPSNQIDVTGSYLYDLATGEEDFEGAGDLRYLLIRRE